MADCRGPRASNFADSHKSRNVIEQNSEPLAQDWESFKVVQNCLSRLEQIQHSCPGMSFSFGFANDDIEDGADEVEKDSSSKSPDISSVQSTQPSLHELKEMVSD